MDVEQGELKITFISSVSMRFYCDRYNATLLNHLAVSFLRNRGRYPFKDVLVFCCNKRKYLGRIENINYEVRSKILKSVKEKRCAYVTWKDKKILFLGVTSNGMIKEILNNDDFLKIPQNVT
jgi:hypothetical protein